MNLFFSKLLVSIVLLFIISNGSVAAGLFRWIDDQGNVFYSDKVPPRHSKLRHEVLDKDGKVIGTVQREMTPEEFMRAQTMKKLKGQEKGLLSEQAARDRVLLRTFRSEKDMVDAYQRKIATIDVLIRLEQANIKRLTDQLEVQRKQAAQLDRDGKKVPKKLIGEIQSTQQHLTGFDKKIASYEQEKEVIQGKHERELHRFRVLVADKDQPVDDTYTATLPASEGDNSIPGLVKCGDEGRCSEAWKAAKLFVERYSTTALTINTAQILKTAEPAEDDDISLTVSKLVSKTARQRLFLNVYCNKSDIGKALCNSEKVRVILASFKPFVNEALEPSAPQE